jgi:hypothetical protein
MRAQFRIGEETPRPEESDQVVGVPQLWSTAPAWRNLVIASGVLTALAISVPMVQSEVVGNIGPPSGSPAQSEPSQQNCPLQIPNAPQHLMGRVASFVPVDRVLAATKEVENQIGAKISPAYLHLKRAWVSIAPQNGTSWSTFGAIPEYMTVNIGDSVELNSRYRDPSLPCHFIPWTINRVVGQAGNVLIAPRLGN